VDNPELPILYNVNFGHGAPQAILPYGTEAVVNADEQEIVLL
jgi:muramoyltetrapeptide carboxypeptidase LdcA involved in peptidoglycan recycling